MQQSPCSIHSSRNGFRMSELIDVLFHAVFVCYMTLHGRLLLIHLDSVAGGSNACR